MPAPPQEPKKRRNRRSPGCSLRRRAGIRALWSYLHTEPLGSLPGLQFCRTWTCSVGARDPAFRAAQGACTCVCVCVCSSSSRRIRPRARSRPCCPLRLSHLPICDGPGGTPALRGMRRGAHFVPAVSRHAGLATRASRMALESIVPSTCRASTIAWPTRPRTGSHARAPCSHCRSRPCSARPSALGSRWLGGSHCCFDGPSTVDARLRCGQARGKFAIISWQALLVSAVRATPPRLAPALHRQCITHPTGAGWSASHPWGLRRPGTGRRPAQASSRGSAQLQPTAFFSSPWKLPGAPPPASRARPDRGRACECATLSVPLDRFSRSHARFRPPGSRRPRQSIRASKRPSSARFWSSAEPPPSGRPNPPVRLTDLLLACAAPAATSVESSRRPCTSPTRSGRACSWPRPSYRACWP